MSQFIHVILQGAVYSTGRRSADNDAMLTLVCKHFAGASREFAVNTLYRGISSEWRLQDDIPNPFSDSRECLVSAVRVIDLDNDILTLHKKDVNRRLPLSKVREGPVSIPVMEPFEPAPLPKFNWTEALRHQTGNRNSMWQSDKWPLSAGC
ncbi:hypothetical protein M432DRAFT_156499 [Thermoascus aurantiacus ATCC 26904]